MTVQAVGQVRVQKTQNVWRLVLLGNAAQPSAEYRLIAATDLDFKKAFYRF